MALSEKNSNRHPEHPQVPSMRQLLVDFYDQHLYRDNPRDPDQLFTIFDKEEALAYFDQRDDSLSATELFQRHTRSVLMLPRTKAWAQRQKHNFITRLEKIDIALDKKRAWIEQFMRGSFLLKAEIFSWMEQEEARVAHKKREQLLERESYKSVFFSFYAQHSQYFCYEDRISAWNNVLMNLSHFSTHKGKINRLKLLVAMLPSNLAYARKLEEEYNELLKSRIENTTRQIDCMNAFRECTFFRKAQRISELRQLPTLREIREKNAREKQEHTLLYKSLYELFPHGTTPEEFSELTIKDQKEIIEKKKASNKTEQNELDKLLLFENITTEEISSFRKKTLAGKKSHLQALKKQKETVNTVAPTPETAPLEKSTKNHILCSIVISVLRNKEEKKFADDKERVKAIKKQLEEKGISADFSLEHLQIIQSILQVPAGEYHETPQYLQWLEKNLRERIYVGESRTDINSATDTKTKVPNKAA